MIMCVIYLPARAFAVVTKATGNVAGVVALGMQVISIEFLYAGILSAALPGGKIAPLFSKIEEAG